MFHVMFATCAIGGIHYGTGRHMAELEQDDIVKAMRVSISVYMFSNDI